MHYEKGAKDLTPIPALFVISAFTIVICYVRQHIIRALHITLERSILQNECERTTSK